MFITYDNDASMPTTELVYCSTCGTVNCTHDKYILKTAVRAERDNTYRVGHHIDEK